MSTELTAFFDRVRPAIEATLDQLLPSANASPARIHQAMRYSTMDGGKRIRPSEAAGMSLGIPIKPAPWCPSSPAPSSPRPCNPQSRPRSKSEPPYRQNLYLISA